MASVNKVILVGNLGADPESRYMPNGDAVVNIRLATTESWKDKASGEKREATEWHNIVAFRKLAEICGQYLAKGSSVYIEGRIKTEKWQDKEGNDRYTTKIYADEMKMLGGKRDGEQRASSDDGSSRPASNAPQGAPAAGGFNDIEDDIPFAPINRKLAMSS